jgi:hypothetical protein
MTITLNDYNILQSRLARVFEIGDGDYGYGQTASSVQITSAIADTTPFENLRTDILAALQHQKGVVSRLPIPPVTSSLSDTDWAKYSTTMTLVEQNRLATLLSSQATAESIASVSSTSGQWSGTSTHTVNVTFQSDDEMRNYFNTSSAITFNASRAGGTSNAKNIAWTSLLSSIGTVNFRRSATASSKTTGGTQIGYSKLTEVDQIIFTKAIASAPSNNVYTIMARLDLTTSSIVFTITYTNAGENVTGTLTSNVGLYRASGSFVTAAIPVVVQDFVEGLANPSFAITRTSATVDEGSSVTFYVDSTNFLGTAVYWTIVGYGVSANDFEETKTLGLTGPCEIDVTGHGQFTLTASKDSLTEGTERFNIEIRTAQTPTSPVVASISTALEAVTDTSVYTVPALTSYRFTAQSTTSVPEGRTVSYTVVSSGVTDGTTVKWAIKPLTTGIDSSDFQNGLSGTVDIYSNTATIDIFVLSDSKVESLESFQVNLFSTDAKTGRDKLEATSYLMQIEDTVVVTVVPKTMVYTTGATIREGDSVGVTFKVTTRTLPVGTRWYYKIFPKVGTLEATDFNDGVLEGSFPIINQVGTFAKYAKSDNRTEGLESYYVMIYSDAGFAFPEGQSDDFSITESVPFTISRLPVTIAEGGVETVFTVTTPAEYAGAQLYWTTVSDSGTTVNDSDFDDNLTTDAFTISDLCIGTIRRRAITDSAVEGTEYFHLEIRDSAGTAGKLLASSQTVSITEDVSYTISNDTVSIEEGLESEAKTKISFIVKTPKVTAGTVLYWSTIVDNGSVTGSDFTDGRLTGTVTITNNTGEIIRYAAVDGLTEGNEKFHLELRTGSASGTVVASSAVITITEFVKYSITASTASMREGAAGVQFNVTTPKVPDGTKVYWTALTGTGNITENDFVVSDAQGGSSQRLSGYVSTLSNRASFIIAAKPDTLTEGNESFQIQLRTEAIDGPVEGVTPSITISEIVAYTITADVTSTNETTNRTVAFTVYSPKVDDGTLLYWTTATSSGEIAGSDFVDGVTQGQVQINFDEAINKYTGSIVRQVKEDETTEGLEAFYIQVRASSYTSSVLAGSPVVIVNDTSLDVEELPPPNVVLPTYDLTSDVSTIMEGESVLFTLSIPNYATVTAPKPTKLYWTLWKGPGLDNSDVSAVSGEVDLDGSGSATQSISATLAGGASEGTEGFIFEMRPGSLTGPAVKTKPITVTKQKPYTITAVSKTLSEGGAGVSINVSTPLTIAGTLQWEIIPIGDVTAADFTGNATSGTVSIDGTGKGSFTLTAAADSLTEGNELFKIELKDPNNSNASFVPAITTQDLTISEIVDYNVALTSSAQLSEGGTATYTFTTPKLPSDTVYRYTLIGKSGNITKDDFTGRTSVTSDEFTVPSATCTYDISVQIASDGLTEGNESFYLDFEIKGANNVFKPVTVICPTVTITETVSYAINVSATSVPEGTPITFYVTTPKMASNSNLWWQFASGATVNAADFVEGQTYGLLPIDSSGTRSVTMTLTPKSTDGTEGNETFAIEILDQQGGTVQCSSSLITVTEAVGYVLKPSSLTLVEGSTVSVELTTPKNSANTTYYWRLTNTSGIQLSGSASVSAIDAADFTAVTGTVVSDASTSTGTFDITLLSDSTQESTNEIKIVISNSPGGGSVSPINDPTLTILDNTKFQIVTVPAGITSIVEGNTNGVKFEVTTPSSVTDSALYWSVVGVDGTLNTTTDIKLASGIVAIANNGNHKGYFTVAANTDAFKGEGESFKVVLKRGSQNGTPLIESNYETGFAPPTITISDAEEYAISTGAVTITEGGIGVTFTITALSTDIGSRLYWRIKGTAGLLDFNPVGSDTSFTGWGLTDVITSSKTAAVIISAKEDQVTEGLLPETFYIEISKTQTGTALKSSAAVSITDSSKTAPPNTVFGISYTSVPRSVSAPAVINIEPSIYSTLTTTGKTINWEIVNATPEIQKLVQSANKTTATGGTLITGTGRFANFAAANTSYSKLALHVPTSSTSPAGNFQVKFTTTDPKTSQAISVTSDIFTINRKPVTDKIAKRSIWNVPAGVTSVQLKLVGEGGDGGGAAISHATAAASAKKGGAGSNGDLVTGTYAIPAGVTSLFVNFILGGAPGFPKYWAAYGGWGGNAAAVYAGSSATGTPIAVAAGGGGGGSGGRTGVGDSGDATTSTSTYNAVTTSTGANGVDGGGGGGGGGGPVSSTAAISQYTSINGRPAGVGGKSYVPTGFTRVSGGGGAGGVAGLPTVGKENAGYATTASSDPDNDNDFPLFDLQYAIWEPNATATSVFAFNNIDDFFPAATGTTYIIRATSDDAPCTVTIDGVLLFPNKGRYSEEKTITLKSTWNRRITVTVDLDPGNRRKPGPVSVTLREKGTAYNNTSAILWHTRMPLNYLVGDGFGGGASDSTAYVEITYQPVGELATITAVPPATKVAPSVPAASYTPVVRTPTADPVTILTAAQLAATTVVAPGVGTVIAPATVSSNLTAVSGVLAGLTVASTRVAVQGPTVAPVAGATVTVQTNVKPVVTAPMIELGPKALVASVTYGIVSDVLEISFSDPLRGKCAKYDIEFHSVRTATAAGNKNTTTGKVTITNPGSSVVTNRCNVTPNAVQKSKLTTDGFLAVFNNVVLGVTSKSGTSYVSSLQWINITITSYPLSTANGYSKGVTTFTKIFPNPTVPYGTVRSDGSTSGIAPVVLPPAPVPVPTYATGSYIPRGVNDGYSSYWVYPKVSWAVAPLIPKLYWEDLNIKVETSGMYLRAVIVDHQAGSITLTDQYGVKWTHIPTIFNWNSAIVIPQTLNIIVKIEFNAGLYGYGAADIKNSAGTVVWHTQNPWKHSV